MLSSLKQLLVLLMCAESYLFAQEPYALDPYDRKTELVATTQDADGNFFVLSNAYGKSKSVLSTSQISFPIVVSYDRKGKSRWARKLIDFNWIRTEGMDLSVDSSGNVYVVGVFSSSQVFLTKLNGSSGDYLSNANKQKFFTLQQKSPRPPKYVRIATSPSQGSLNHDEIFIVVSECFNPGVINPISIHQLDDRLDHVSKHIFATSNNTLRDLNVAATNIAVTNDGRIVLSGVAYRFEDNQFHIFAAEYPRHGSPKLIKSVQVKSFGHSGSLSPESLYDDDYDVFYLLRRTAGIDSFINLEMYDSSESSTKAMPAGLDIFSSTEGSLRRAANSIIFAGLSQNPGELVEGYHVIGRGERAEPLPPLSYLRVPNNSCSAQFIHSKR